MLTESSTFTPNLNHTMRTEWFHVLTSLTWRQRWSWRSYLLLTGRRWYRMRVQLCSSSLVLRDTWSQVVMLTSHRLVNICRESRERWQYFLRQSCCRLTCTVLWRVDTWSWSCSSREDTRYISVNTEHSYEFVQHLVFVLATEEPRSIYFLDNDRVDEVVWEVFRLSVFF